MAQALLKTSVLDGDGADPSYLRPLFVLDSMIGRAGEVCSSPMRQTAAPRTPIRDHAHHPGNWEHVNCGSVGALFAELSL